MSMKPSATTWRTLVVAVALLCSGHAGALTINFDYRFDTNNFFTDARKSLLEQAGNVFSIRLGDTLAVTSNISRTFASPGGTGASVQINNFTAAQDTVTVFVGGRDLGGSLGQGGSVFNSANRGEGANDFAPLFGLISFSTTASWYFDTNPENAEGFSGLSDFYSVALHELGHVLGIGLAPSWNSKLAGTANNYTGFSGVNSRSLFGGSNPPVTANGAHWREGLLSTVNGQAQEAALDPTLTVGTRKRLTDLDWAALQDIGWEVAPAPVPLPPAMWLLGSVLVGLVGVSRRPRQIA